MNIIKLAGKPVSTSTKRRIKKFILQNIYFDRLVTTYDSWIVKNFPDALEVLKQTRESQTFSYKPLISVTVPTYDTPEIFLRECIDSVLAQSYQNWELVLVDDASPNPMVRQVIAEYAAMDDRIHCKFLDKNLHIAGATNEAIKLSSGEFVGLFDHDDILWPNALYEVVKALNMDQTIDFLYTDEDKIVEERSRHAEPFFKPDWSPALLQTCNYITHLSVFRRELLDQVGFEDGAYNGAQDWEMILRATRSARRVHHIPKVVYSWRVHDASTAKTMDSKPYVVAAQKATIAADLHARGFSDDQFDISQNPGFNAFWKTTWTNIGTPKVSIISLSKKQSRGIERRTTYSNCEFIVAENYQEGLKRAIGEYVVLVEPGVSVTSKRWIEVLLNSAVQADVGLVGGMTLYKNGYIYSAGMAVNESGELIHILSSGVRLNGLSTLTRNVYAHTRRDVTALSGCVMGRADLLKSAKFDTKSTTSEQLVSLATSLIDAGFHNIYEPDLRSRVDDKFVRSKKQMSDGRREASKDRVHGWISAQFHESAIGKRYFYDDIVSYPDING